MKSTRSDRPDTAIGILGGTFDPVHIGHISIARELCDVLHLAELRLLPSGRPPHRHKPRASADQRLRWVQRAVEGLPRLVVDDRELRRAGPSFTVDTLTQIRDEHPDTPLCFLLGTDAFNSLHQWHRWQEIPALAHLVVAGRPGETPRPDAAVSETFDGRTVRLPDELLSSPSGKLLFWPVKPVPVSATRVRNALAIADPGISHWLPPSVADEIVRAACYRNDTDNEI